MLKLAKFFSIWIFCKRTQYRIFARWLNVFACKVMKLAVFVAIEAFLCFKIFQCASFLWSELTRAEILTAVLGSRKLISFSLHLIIQTVRIFFIAVELNPRRMRLSVRYWKLLATFVTCFSHDPRSWLSLLNFLGGPERWWTEIFGSFKVTNFAFDFLDKMLVSLYTWLAGWHKHISKLLISFLQLRRLFLFPTQLHLQLLDAKCKWLMVYVSGCVLDIERVVSGKIDWLIFSGLLIERNLLVWLSVVLAWHLINWAWEAMKIISKINDSFCLYINKIKLILINFKQKIVRYLRSALINSRCNHKSATK